MLITIGAKSEEITLSLNHSLVASSFENYKALILSNNSTYLPSSMPKNLQLLNYLEDLAR